MGNVALEETVEYAGVRLFYVPKTDIELTGRLSGVRAFAEDKAQAAEQPGAVRAAFAMDERRILDFFEQFFRAPHAHRAGRRARTQQWEIDELDAVARARRRLKPVAPAIALAPQINDGPDALIRAKRRIWKGEG